MIPDAVKQRLFTAFVALLLVTASIGGALGPASSTQTAEAATLFQDCDLSDSIVGAFIEGIVNPNSDECRFNPDDNTDYDQISKTDAYAQAVAINGSTNRYLGTYSNFVEDSESIAISKAKIEIINSLNNGSSKATARNEAKLAVRKYYARMQKNVIADWNAKNQQAYYLDQTGLTINIVSGAGSDSVDSWSVNGTATNASYQLVNGSYATVADAGGSGDELVGNSKDLVAEDPSTTDSVIMIGWPDRKETLDNISSSHSRVESNVDAYVDAVYANYSQGEIDSVDLATADPSAIAQEASTARQSSGYYGYAAIELASLGYSGNITASHTVDVLDSNGDKTQTLTGTLYYTGDDVSSWETNKTYDLSNLSGVVYMAAQDPDGSAQTVDLSERGSQFKITEATNTQTGESLNETVIEQKTYRTFDASNLGEELDRLQELRSELEQQESQSGGVGFLEGTALGGVGGAGLALGAVLLILLLGRN